MERTVVDAQDDGSLTLKRERVDDRVSVAMRPPSRRNAPLDFSDDTKLHFPYKANFNDHFETSVEALQDLMPVLQAFRALVRPNCPEKFTLYDPYYCAGAIRGHWKQLGIDNLIHEKRDFYADMEDGTVPKGFDMLVTNPPFSDDHIERLLDFLIGFNKPFAFLVPDYVASKDWYTKRIESCFTPNELTFRGQRILQTSTITAQSRRTQMPPQATNAVSATFVPRRPAVAPPPMPPWLINTSSSSASEGSSETSAKVFCAADASGIISVGVEPFYVVPRGRYDFKHPLGAGHDSSHFKSMWFVWCGKRTNEVIRAAACEMAKMENGPRILSGLAELRDAHVARSDVRKNPRQRAREKK